MEINQNLGYGDEPNRVADVYRGYKSPSVPFQIEKHLEFIEISEDGYMLLGSSNLNGRYWTGSVWYFLEAEGAPDKEKCLTGVDCSTSVSAGKFLDSKQKIVVGEDTGTVTMFTLTELEEDHSFHLIGEATRSDHDSSVLSISVSNDKTKVVTSGADMCIIVRNSEDLLCENMYRLAHVDHVTCVAFRPQDANYIFSSSSLDGTVLLWDSRQSKPATVLRDTPKEGISALAWHNTDDNILAVGTVLGNTSLLDLRTSSSIVETRHYRRPIHKLLFIDTRWLAATADSHEVKVLDSSSQTLNVLYTDDRHNDFARGLAWHPKLQSLFSCGWDKQVLTHYVSPLPNTIKIPL